MYFFLAIVGIPLVLAIINLAMTGIPRSLTHREDATAPVASMPRRPV